VAGGIFINYRRALSLKDAQLLQKGLQRHFGQRGVFLDVSGLDGGDHWLHTLEKQVDASAAMVALIGPGWADVTDEKGSRRLDNPNDFVRFELARAFSRSLPVLPVLIDGADMPEVARLPTNLLPLTFPQAMHLRSQSLDDDADKIARRLRYLIAQSRPRGVSYVAAGAGAVAALALGIAAGPMVLSKLNLPFPGVDLPNDPRLVTDFLDAKYDLAKAARERDAVRSDLAASQRQLDAAKTAAAQSAAALTAAAKARDDALAEARSAKAEGERLRSDLDAAKADLTKATRERDGLKVELAKSQSQPDTLKSPAASQGTLDLILEPQQLYERAYGYLLQKDYGAAESTFEDFLKRYPSHQLAGNAQYWLGETFFIRGQYRPAAAAFLKGYQEYFKSQKASENLLKHAMSLQRLGQRDAACFYYNEFAATFPNPPAHIRNLAQAERQRGGC
jgi:tol-pal system protein YbgF